MRCPHCNEPLDDDGVFCGYCGKQVAPMYARGATVAEVMVQRQAGNTGHVPLANGYEMYKAPVQSLLMAQPTRPPIAPQTPVEPFSVPPRMPSYAAKPVRNNPKNMAFFTIIFILLIVGILAGTITLFQNKTLASQSSTQNIITFSDSTNGQGKTDSLSISVSGLSAPPAGSQYKAWLMNEMSEDTLALGTLQAQKQAFVLSFNNKGANLLATGNRIEITREKSDASLPTGDVLFTASFPQQAFIHIKHLLLSFPTTPNNIGLLVGLHSQVQQLNQQAQQLKNAANNKNAVRCEAQSIIDIIEGNQGQQARPLPSTCISHTTRATGDGFGLLGQGSSGYIASVAAHASLAATQGDATPMIKTQAHYVIIATDNLKNWLTIIDQDARSLLTNPGDMAKIQQIAALSDHALNGVDQNDDGRIDPELGEAGATSAYQYGQMMASLSLTSNQ